MTIQFVRDDLVGYVIGRVTHDTPNLATGVTFADQIIPAGSIIIGCEVAILETFDGAVTIFSVGHVGNADAGAAAADVTHGTVGIYQGDNWRSGTEATAGLTSSRPMTIRVNGTNTTGEAQCIIYYMRAVSAAA